LPPSVSSYVAPLKPTPEVDLPQLRGGDLTRKGQPAAAWTSSQLQFGPTLEQRLDRMVQSLATIDQRQIATLNRIEQHVTRKRSDLRAVVATIGLDADRLEQRAKLPAAQGGPFVPYKVDARMGPFESALSRIQPAFIEAEKLSTLTRALPLARPLPAQYETTSTFGYRADPFTRSAAMHTGIDFRAETGTSVRATAPGKVITSAYQGGYGNMVEIDHGMGLTTRYAHLSALLVDEGETVQAGAVVGRVGSTGRSTGPHLHYETRLDDDPLDPRRFLRAGEKFSLATSH
jgi:murein DD-endopeptidase MepM/ murein hydrolase activator NlpD